MYRVVFLGLAFLASLAVATRREMECSGSAEYKITFRNLLTNRRFNDSIPEGGLMFSPLAGVSHTNRQSFLTVRGFASRTVEEIAETGNNMPFLERANRLHNRGEGVLDHVSAEGLTLPGKKSVITLKVDCDHHFVTVLAMIAPSPDWIVQINNINLLKKGKFIYGTHGTLIAYDAGTDDGREFTDPMDPSLDIPTEPKINIAPLVEDETDRFDGRRVGRYFVERMM